MSVCGRNKICCITVRSQKAIPPPSSFHILVENQNMTSISVKSTSSSPLNHDASFSLSVFLSCALFRSLSLRKDRLHCGRTSTQMFQHLFSLSLLLTITLISCTQAFFLVLVITNVWHGISYVLYQQSDFSPCSTPDQINNDEYSVFSEYWRAASVLG